MGKIWCQRNKEYLFANKLCAEYKDCKENCVYTNLKYPLFKKLIKRQLEIFTKEIEPLIYRTVWHFGLSYDLSMTKIDHANTIRLWSLPEPYGHAVHQESAKEYDKLFFKSPKKKKIIFERILGKYEVLARKNFKHYLCGKWHIENKPLWKELDAMGYVTPSKR